MKNKGFSFIEAIISAAILSVITIPALSGFRQAYRNYNSSMDYYKAGLHVQSMLCGILYEGADIYTVLANDTAYETNKYNYALYECILQNGEIINYEAYSSSGVPAELENLNVEYYSNRINDFINWEERLIIVDAYTKSGTLLIRSLSFAADGMQ